MVFKGIGGIIAGVENRNEHWIQEYWIEQIRDRQRQKLSVSRIRNCTQEGWL